jgi:catechol 2,3-dioxygenase-like lactoylglutathione lyase family enzyme
VCYTERESKSGDGVMRMLRIQRVLETSLYVADLEAATEFYTQVLGLRAFSKVGGRHTFFRCGDGVVLLFNPSATEAEGGNVPPHGARGAGHVAFAIQASDIPSWREHLASHGVEVEREVTWPGKGQSIYFRDPAGNSVELATPQIWGFEADEA